MEMLDKKQIRQIFLSEFKMGPKAVEVMCNVKVGFGPGMSQCSVAQGILLRDGESWRWRAIIRANPLTATPEAARELAINDSTVALYLGDFKKVEGLTSECLLRGLKKKKFWIVFLSLDENQWTIS